MRDLAQLPKAHLHLHLEGGIRPTTLAQLADHHGMPRPRVTGFADFTEFDTMYQAACAVLKTPEDLARLVFEIAEDAAAFGCRWVEPAVWLPLHRSRLGADEEILEMLVESAARATEATGVGIGYLIASDRNLAPDDAVEQARIAARWAGRGVVAFGLHNDERRFAPDAFAPAFDIARDASEPTGFSTACVRWRIPNSSTGSRAKASASTSARRRTCCSASHPRSRSIRCDSCSRRGFRAASTATTRSCSIATSVPNTNSAEAACT